jgi:hypothetical protein
MLTEPIPCKGHNLLERGAYPVEMLTEPIPSPPVPTISTTADIIMKRKLMQDMEGNAHY